MLIEGRFHKDSIIINTRYIKYIAKYTRISEKYYLEVDGFNGYIFITKEQYDKIMEENENDIRYKFITKEI